MLQACIDDNLDMVEFLVAGERSHGARVREAAKALIQANLGWLKQQEGVCGKMEWSSEG